MSTDGSSSDRRVQVVMALRAHLEALSLAWEEGSRPGETVVTLPGERKLKTVVSLLVRRRQVRVRAFVIRAPDENHTEVYAYLLRRNLRLPGVGYAIDANGDVFVVGQFSVDQVSQAMVDDVLGAVLNACDDPFNELLALGFLSAMKAEWAWRVARGESTANLEAFRSLLEQEHGPQSSTT